MGHRKNIIMFVLLISVAVMTVVYAAFSTNLIINGTTSQSGTFGVVLTGCTTEVVKVGTAGGSSPSATCSPSGASTEGVATCSANFMQPGDSVRCKFNVKNTGNLKVKADGVILCDDGDSASGGLSTSFGNNLVTKYVYGNAGSGFATSGPYAGMATGNITTGGYLTYGIIDGPYGDSLTYNSGMTLTGVWNKNSLAAGQTLTDEFSITLTAPDTSNWAIKPLGSVSCFINYVQDI